MSSGRLPLSVLSQELADAIRGRRVRAGFFTTYAFDPGFFELQVLPLLFDEAFSQVDKLRRIQLEGPLSGTDLAVYYDRSALSQDAEPAQLDYRRIDVGRRTGCFHPKVILLLVDEPPEGDGEDEATAAYQSLIVGILSANLTRAGWWESVEAAHIEEIQDRDLGGRRCSFRADLLSLVRRVRESAGPGEDHGALDRIHEFLLQRTPRGRFQRSSSSGRYYTRIFLGQDGKSLSAWLADLRLDRREWNLEVISPYFDRSGAGPLVDLVETLEPRETRVYLPRDADGTALVSSDTYAAVGELARWGALPASILQRSRSATSDRLPPRRVHAKVYRLWSRDAGDLLLVGSVNLTSAGHSHARAGNLESAFLVDVSDQAYPRRWWLEPLELDAERFMQTDLSEDEGLGRVPLDLSLRYDWSTGELAYRLERGAPGGFEVAETTGRTLFRLAKPAVGRWLKCPEDAAERVRELLLSTSFLLIRHSAGEWRVLVREEGMSQRPSLLLDLSPEEILEYWSLLTTEQRLAYLEMRVGAEGELEGLLVGARERLLDRNTLFDRFAGIYHAFGCLRTHVAEAIEQDQPREAEVRLLGAKYDSLPALLDKTWEREETDIVIRYVTVLCARQLRDALAKEFPDFFAERARQVAELDRRLERLPMLRASLDLADVPDQQAFLEWYEDAFLADLSAEARR